MTQDQAVRIVEELRRGRVRPFTSITMQKLVGGWAVSLVQNYTRGAGWRQKRWLVRSLAEWREKRDEMLYRSLAGHPKPEVTR